MYDKLRALVCEVEDAGVSTYKLNDTCRVGNPSDTTWDDADFSRPCAVLGEYEGTTFVLIKRGESWMVGFASLNRTEGEGHWYCTCALSVPKPRPRTSVERFMFGLTGPMGADITAAEILTTLAENTDPDADVEEPAMPYAQWQAVAKRMARDILAISRR